MSSYNVHDSVTSFEIAEPIRISFPYSKILGRYIYQPYGGYYAESEKSLSIILIEEILYEQDITQTSGASRGSAALRDSDGGVRIPLTVLRHVAIPKPKGQCDDVLLALPRRDYMEEATRISIATEKFDRKVRL